MTSLASLQVETGLTTINQFLTAHLQSNFRTPKQDMLLIFPIKSMDLAKVMFKSPNGNPPTERLTLNMVVAFWS